VDKGLVRLTDGHPRARRRHRCQILQPNSPSSTSTPAPLRTARERSTGVISSNTVHHRLDRRAPHWRKLPELRQFVSNADQIHRRAHDGSKRWPMPTRRHLCLRRLGRKIRIALSTPTAPAVTPLILQTPAHVVSCQRPLRDTKEHTAECHASELLDWLAERQKRGPMLYRSVHTAYLQMTRERGWPSCPWNRLARQLALRLSNGRKTFVWGIDTAGRPRRFRVFWLP
jgi:hypothetical protein